MALIAVLEAMEPGPPETGARRTLICVANTHIHANPELNDVKLWQVHTLLKGLEKIAARCAWGAACSRHHRKSTHPDRRRLRGHMQA